MGLALGLALQVLQRAKKIHLLQSWELMESVLPENWHNYERGAREFSRSCQGRHPGGEPLKADGATRGMKGAKGELGLLSVGTTHPQPWHLLPQE